MFVESQPHAVLEVFARLAAPERRDSACGGYDGHQQLRS